LKQKYEKLMAFALASLILMLLLDQFIGIGLFEGNIALTRFVLLIVLAGSMSIIIRRIRNKNDE
jgi:hypothetical protein